MDGLLFPILIAAAVMLLIWSVARLAAGGPERQKRKLAERLSTEGRHDGRPETEVRPITLRLEVVGLPPFLADQPFIQALNRRVVQAFPNTSLQKFLMISLIMGFTGMFTAFGLTGSMLMTTTITLASAYLPFMYLNRKRFKRQKLMSEQLPEALDFLSRVLRAGHSFSTGLQMMADELPKPLNEELRRCYDQHSLGQALEESLKETAARIESSDFAFFVTSVLIQRQTGGDLSEVLKNISGMIRGRLRLAQQVRAKTAEGRFTGYILVAFPAIMFILAYSQNPEYCGKLLHGTGLYFLGAAFGLQMLGLWSIRKITTVKV
jgi:tight adherence protein B